MLDKKLVTTQEDVATLMPVIQEIWSEVFVPIIGQDQVTYMLATYQSQATIEKEIAEGVQYYLLYLEGEVVGYSAFAYEEDAFYISKIYLKQSLRGQGHSSALFQWFEELAKEKNLPKLRLKVNQGNERAINVYKHKGFDLVHNQVVDIGEGFVMEDFVFEKELA